MNKMIRNISLLLCVVATFMACKRKAIYDSCICNDTLTIPIDIDWTKSGVNPQNVTVLFYDDATGDLVSEHIYEHNTEEIQSYATLKSGSYRAVVFNELRDQIDYVSCVDHENISTLKFESNDNDPVKVNSSTRSYVEQPGDLAVAVVEGIVVTDDMISEAAYSSGTKSLSSATKATVDKITDVSPEKKSNTIDITVHFNGLNNARTPALADLINLSDGYFVESGTNSSTTSTIQFYMSDREYDDDGRYRDGTISATVTSFGTLVDRTSTESHDDDSPIMLDILFQLVDSDMTEISRKIDVTDIIQFTEKEDGSMLLTINASSSEDIPDVTPDGSSGESGLGSDLSDWVGEDVPLTQQ